MGIAEKSPLVRPGRSGTIPALFMFSSRWEIARMCRVLLLLVLALLPPLVGCQDYFDEIHNRWFEPGPASIQRSRAVRFDPYPDQAAGPKVEGGRPLEYQQPPAEPARAQQWRSPWGTAVR